MIKNLAFEPQDLVGHVICSDYKIAEYLDCGAFGAVYRAINHGTEDPFLNVAIKIIPPLTGDKWTSLPKEVSMLSTLSHTHLISHLDSGIIESGMATGCAYLVMEYAESSLEKQLALKPMSAEDIKTLIVQLCRVLWYMNKQGITHRDVKPANILYSEGVWKLADLGLVGQFSHELTFASLVCAGTPIFSPPEANLHLNGIKVDSWPIGVIAYICLTNRWPLGVFVSRDLANDLESPYDDIVHRTLQFEPNVRCTCGDVLRILGVSVPEIIDDNPSESLFDGSAIYTVSADGPGDYRTIQQAIDAAHPDLKTIIHVQPGRYQESLKVNKPVLLQGIGPGDNIRLISTDGPCATLSCEFASLNNMQLTSTPSKANSRDCAVFLDDNYTSIRNCIIRSACESAIYIGSDLTGPSISYCTIAAARSGVISNYSSFFHIHKTKIHDAVNSAIHLGGDSQVELSEVSIENSGIAIHLVDDSQARISDCSFSSCSDRGILVAGASKIRIVDTEILDCQNGAWVANGSEAQLTGVTIAGSKNIAVLAEPRSYCSLTDCMINDNNVAGIIQKGARGASIDCTTDGNKKPFQNQSEGTFSVVQS